MNKVIILFQNNDEYGHWDIIGVYSSEDELNIAWKTLVDTTKEINGDNYYGPVQESLLNWDFVVEATKKKYGRDDIHFSGGDGYYWKWVEINNTFGRKTV